jgi:hypothetical protein
MNHAILQFIHLENLLAEAAGADALRVHVLEQSETTTSNVLTRKEITIGLCVRAIAPGRRILSWYYEVDKFSLYLPERPANGNGHSPERERYEAAWQRAITMQEELVTLLRQQEHTVHTDGVIELNLPRLLRGTMNLAEMPSMAIAASGG